MQDRRAVSTNVVVIAVIIAVACVGIVSYLLYQKSLEDARIRYENSLQPNIQATVISISSPIRTPTTTNVVNLGRVSTSGSFSHKATTSGDYYMIFDNSFSTISSKTLQLTYSTGASQTTTLTIPAGTSQFVKVSLNAGQQLSGSYSITGGSGNDVNFRIETTTYTQRVSFQCTLVNAGTSDGFANIAFTSDGTSVYSNKYYVAMGVSVLVSGSVTINDGNSHVYDLVVVNQYKP